MTNRELNNLYLLYNRKFFGNKLSKNASVRFSKTPGDMAYCFQVDGMTVVRVNKMFKDWPRVAEGCLFHEMAHLATNCHSHGRKFQAEMLGLAKQGAFKHIW